MAVSIPVFEFGSITLGMREGVFALITLVAVYMLFVVVRMRRLSRPVEAPVVSEPAPAPVPPLQEETEPEVAPTGDEAAWDDGAPAAMAEGLVQRGLEEELAMLREEVDAMRGELAALRADMHQDLAQMRATQSVSPIYGDAMHLAMAGYDPAMIAERCGIARAEAELVVALAKSQER